MPKKRKMQKKNKKPKYKSGPSMETHREHHNRVEQKRRVRETQTYANLEAEVETETHQEHHTQFERERKVRKTQTYANLQAEMETETQQEHHDYIDVEETQSYANLGAEVETETQSYEDLEEVEKEALREHHNRIERARRKRETDAYANLEAAVSNGEKLSKAKVLETATSCIENLRKRIGKKKACVKEMRKENLARNLEIQILEEKLGRGTEMELDENSYPDEPHASVGSFKYLSRSESEGAKTLASMNIISDKIRKLHMKKPHNEEKILKPKPE